MQRYASSADGPGLYKKKEKKEGTYYNFFLYLSLIMVEPINLFSFNILCVVPPIKDK